MSKITKPTVTKRAVKIPLAPGQKTTVTQSVGNPSYGARTQPLNDHAKALKATHNAGIPAHMIKSFGK
jgi:hypothetical protein